MIFCDLAILLDVHNRSLIQLDLPRFEPLVQGTVGLLIQRLLMGCLFHRLDVLVYLMPVWRLRVAPIFDAVRSHIL